MSVVGQNLVRHDGQGRWMLEVTRALAERGHQVTVISFKLDDDVAHHPLVRWVRILPIKAPQLVVDVWMILIATIKLRRGRGDVTCILGPCALPPRPYVYFAAFASRAWDQTWKREGLTPGVYRRIYGAVHVWLEERSVRKARALVAMSHLTTSELSAYLNHETAVTVSPGGVDGEEFPSVTDHQRRTARDSLRIPQDAFVISMIGEYTTGRKGLERLAEAVALEPDEREIVVVRGRGPKQRTVERLRALGVEDRFRLLDPGPAQEVLAAADLVIIPSLYEPFSLVALETAASGLPLIISNRVGAAEHLLPEGAAISVDPLSAKEMRSAIEKLKDPDAAREMGERGAAVAKKMPWASVSSAAVGAVELAAGLTSSRGSDSH